MTRTLALAAVALATVLCGCTGRARAGGEDAGDARTFRHDGLDRRYVVRVPQPVPSGRLPLVIVLHGGGGNAESAERMTGFTAKARAEGFIVVYPEGTARRGRFYTWNAGHCCGWAMERGRDDVGFISALIDTLVRQLPVDRTRVYVTGMSNGGMMAHRIGLELSHRVAAIAPVVAALFGDEKPPARAVSALMLNGALDRAVPPEGGPPGGRFPDSWDGTPARPAGEQASFWAYVNGCTGPPDTTREGSARRWRYYCPPGLAVELFIIGDQGHAWPGGERGSRMGDEPSPTFRGTDVIWDFFRERRLR